MTLTIEILGNDKRRLNTVHTNYWTVDALKLG
jgi:hypothetical protein